MSQIEQVPAKEKKATGFFSDAFYKAFRALFRPTTRFLKALGVTPNAITLLSLVFGLITGIEIARDHLWNSMLFGFLMSFSDIVDGQLAKEHGLATRFGGILDSTIDRYNEFIIFAGLGARFYFLAEPVWMLVCVIACANSIVISYVKARAEAEGFECNAGLLQRPERLALIGFAVVFDGFLMKPVLAVLAIGTLFTVLTRIMHVKRQADRGLGNK